MLLFFYTTRQIVPDVDVSFYAAWRVFYSKKIPACVVFRNIFNCHYCIEMTSVKMFYSCGFGPRTILRSIGDLPWPHLIWFACQRELCNWHLCRTKKDQLTEKKGFSCRTVCLSLFSAAVCCLWLATDRQTRNDCCVFVFILYPRMIFFFVFVHNELAYGLLQGGESIGFSPHTLPPICEAFNSLANITQQSQATSLWV